MTATAVRSPSLSLPRPRHPADGPAEGAVGGLPTPARSRAAAYQRVLHQLVRRELRTLADLAGWAPDGECARTGALSCHAALVSRVLLHHHAVERETLWPALLRAVTADDRAAAEAAVADWTLDCSRIDARLRDLGTTARQWSVCGSAPARVAFGRACRALADDVDAQTTAEEEALLPLLDRYLEDAAWTTIGRTVRCGLSARQRLLVLGLALEDACAGDRARLLHGAPWGTRLAWRLYGEGRFRASVVRLRGAPPAV